MPIIPQSDPDLLLWAKNFQKVFPGEAPKLGFTTEEIGAVTDDLQALVHVLELIPELRSKLQELTTYKNLLRDGSGAPGSEVGAHAGAVPSLALVSLPKTVAPGVVPRITAVVQRARTSPRCTEAVQKLLCITGPPGPTSGAATLLGQVAPKAKTACLPSGEVRIEFVRGDSDGVVVESRRGDETEWRHLAVDRFSPYVDTRQPLRPGQPERREYRLRYLDEDDPVGPYSDVIVVHTMP